MTKPDGEAKGRPSWENNESGEEGAVPIDEETEDAPMPLDSLTPRKAKAQCGGVKMHFLSTFLNSSG